VLVITEERRKMDVRPTARRIGEKFALVAAAV